MTRRILPREEWPKLHAVGAEIAPALDVLPADAAIVVVEDGDEIVGCWGVMSYVHVEGIWIAPTHRGKGAVLRGLLSGMRETARAKGARAVLTGALSDQVRGLLVRFGAVKLPGDHYVFGVGE